MIDSHELGLAKGRICARYSSEMELLVLSQDRNRIPWPDDDIETKGIAFDEVELRRLGGVRMPDGRLPI